MTSIGPPHLGQSQSGCDSWGAEVAGSICDGKVPSPAKHSGRRDKVRLATIQNSVYSAAEGDCDMQVRLRPESRARIPYFLYRRACE